MHKNIVLGLKNGLYFAADSLRMLQKHPILLTYYSILLIIYCGLFVLAYNLLGHFELPTLELTSDFHMPQQNLLAEIIPETGGLLYMALLLSIFCNIFLRSFLTVALIVHGYALLMGSKGSVRQALHTATYKWPQILKWSALVTGITFGASILVLLPLPTRLNTALVTAYSITWSILTFFVLPIIAIQTRSIKQSIQLSGAYILNTSLEVCGGMLWAVVLIFLVFYSATLVTMLLPGTFGMILLHGIIFMLNALITSGYALFKTKLYHLYHQRITLETEQAQTSADYSQF